MKNKKIRVLVVDDHGIVRAGIRALLKNSKSTTLVGEAKDGLESIALIKKLDPDVIITDISMPNLNGLDLLKQIKDKDEKIKIIIFTMHEEIEYLQASIERGADGYLLKNSNLNELPKAIEAVYSGKNYYSDQLSNSLASVIRNKTSNKTPNVKLSPREIDVLKLIVAGQSNKMIASALSISDKTVAIHRSNIMRKVNANNSADLVRKTIENNILTPDNQTSFRL